MADSSSWPALDGRGSASGKSMSKGAAAGSTSALSGPLMQTRQVRSLGT